MPKRGPYRNYSDDDKARALAALEANNNNLQVTAYLLNIPLPTLETWAKKQRAYLQNPDSPDSPGAVVTLELQNQKRQNLADRFESLAYKILDHIDESSEKLEKATLSQAVTAAAIAVDKCQLLRGRPTSITTQYNERLRRLAEEIAVKHNRSVDQVLADLSGAPAPAPGPPADTKPA